MYDLFGVCITFNCYCNQIRVSTNSTHALSNYLPVVRELIKIYRERNRPRIPSNPCWIIWCVATAWISLSFTECLTLIKLNSIYISRARANKTQRERKLWSRYSSSTTNWINSHLLVWDGWISSWQNPIILTTKLCFHIFRLSFFHRSKPELDEIGFHSIPMDDVHTFCTRCDWRDLLTSDIDISSS